jgi:hypothetical protein
MHGKNDGKVFALGWEKGREVVRLLEWKGLEPQKMVVTAGSTSEEGRVFLKGYELGWCTECDRIVEGGARKESN